MLPGQRPAKNGGKIMLCPKCQNPVQEGLRFCPFCGGLLQIRPMTAPAQQPPQPRMQQPARQPQMQQPPYAAPRQTAAVPGFVPNAAAPVYAAPPERPRRTGLIVAICTAIVLVAAIGTLLIILNNNKKGSGSPDTMASGSVQAETTAETTVPAETLYAPREETEPPAETLPEHTYELIVADCTWEEARRDCAARGGHLVTITSDDEEQHIIQMAEDAGVRFVWIGGYTVVYGEDDIECYWVTGEAFSYEDWLGPYEPTGFDIDGTPEGCLMLWWIQKYDGWGWNDNRNDLSAFSSYTGNMAYVCEYGDGQTDRDYS